MVDKDKDKDEGDNMDKDRDAGDISRYKSAGDNRMEQRRMRCVEGESAGSR